MNKYPPTVIVRHCRENLKKCSLRGLEPRSDCLFLSYPDTILPDMSCYLMLTLDAPPLSPADSDKGLILIDATWRYAATMERVLSPQLPVLRRSLPPCSRTAYPRHQTSCSDPDRGLATVEALYIAYHLMGRDTSGLLDHYYWAEAFLQKNLLTPRENLS
jgi:pre-rRNA-processing protein TSR3